MSTFTPRSEVVSIQYLRAAAAVCVVFFHLGLIFHFQLEFGTAGVDMFFVISGFIMWLVSRHREITPGIFIKKRLVRVVPLYWLVTILLTTGACLRPNLFPEDHPTVSHVLLSLLFIPHLAPNGTVSPLVGQGWTLDYEIFFYLLFTVSLGCSKKYQFQALNAMLLGCVACGFLFHPISPVGKAYTSPLLLELLAGIYICRAWLSQTVLSRKIAWIAIALGVAAIAAAYVEHSTLSRVIRSGIPSALILLGAISLESRGAMPKINFLKTIGDATYSIYLTHYLTWLVVSVALVKLGIGLTLPVYFLSIGIAFMVGMVVYKVVEKPLGKVFSPRRTSETGVAAHVKP